MNKYERTLVVSNNGNLPLYIKELTIDFRGCLIDGIEIVDCEK
jgi:hypothetical protein